GTMVRRRNAPAASRGNFTLAGHLRLLSRPHTSGRDLRKRISQTLVEPQRSAQPTRQSRDRLSGHLHRGTCGRPRYPEGRYQRDERMTRKSLVVYRGHISKHILHPEHGIGAWKLSQLTARGVGEFRDRIRTAGVTVATARKILATLHAVL